MLAKAVTVLVAVVVVVVMSHPQFQNLIPNGKNVLNPCDGSAWPGVGHENPQGGGLRNPFGRDFEAAGFEWTRELCQKDSDGDGKTNGYELGDANCNWNATDPHAQAGTVKGHPGVCEPLGEAACANQTFISCAPGNPVG